MEPWWNGGKTEEVGEKLVSMPPPQMPHVLTGVNPGLCSERPATNYLNHGTASKLE
jgi:hypothetical protein